MVPQKLTEPLDIVFYQNKLIVADVTGHSMHIVTVNETSDTNLYNESAVGPYYHPYSLVIFQYGKTRDVIDIFTGLILSLLQRRWCRRKRDRKKKKNYYYRSFRAYTRLPYIPRRYFERGAKVCGFHPSLDFR